MPKKRKTRQEKIQIDNKKHVNNEVITSSSSSQNIHTAEKPARDTSASTPMTFSLPVSHTEIQEIAHSTKIQKNLSVSIATEEYGYLKGDLLKTALLTGAIVFAELLIRLFFVH